MKRSVLVSVLILILITISSGPVFSRVHPDEYYSVDRPSGEDHPWGGENVSTEVVKTSIGDIFDGGPTGLLLIDIMFSKFFLQSIYIEPTTPDYMPVSSESAVIREKIEVNPADNQKYDIKQDIIQ